MEILVKPIVTEKVTKQSEVLNQYGFVVERRANKVQIKKAVEAAYGVTVVSVNTMNVRPDRSTKYTKSGMIHGKTNAIKKAIVEIAEGETIDLYNNNI
ncbi:MULTISPECIES: 50S ribosomal protein L23 [Flavobacterium]|jgi:large subunit ribosomal protein L23|uniref:Large ribosomal subunit protein uL23 n=1 Tax=Flavobacterium aurantiibacter TaxID=2023067 RepID=A0A255ZQQ2_9FLAO|nr:MULTISPECIES: 50S ribosomal protein L23 [Flavobacterium]OYQ43205.1 50S ribosomal protein L23 [Flavobacterium aurantiibacter]